MQSSSEEPEKSANGDHEAPVREPFGARLDRLLTNADMSPARLSESAHIDPGQVSRIRRGKRLPSVEDLRGIAVAFDLPLDELVAGTTAEPVARRAERRVPADEYQRVLAKSAGLKQQVETLQRELEQVRGRHAALVDELADARAELTRSDVRLGEKDRELERVREELARAEARASDGEARRGALVQKYQRLYEYAVKVVAENKALRSSVVQAQQRGANAATKGAALGAGVSLAVTGLIALLKMASDSDDDEEEDEDEE